MNHNVIPATTGGNICGRFMKKDDKDIGFDAVRANCCSSEATDSYGDCDSSGWPKGMFFNQVLAFAADEDLWLDQFHKAWLIGTENGFYDLTPIDPVYMALLNANSLKASAMALIGLIYMTFN